MKTLTQKAVTGMSADKLTLLLEGCSVIDVRGVTASVHNKDLWNRMFYIDNSTAMIRGTNSTVKVGYVEVQMIGTGDGWL